MDKTALTTLRDSLEHARQLLDYCIGRLREAEAPRAQRWRCRRCEHVQHFPRPVPASTIALCPECESDSFESVS